MGGKHFAFNVLFFHFVLYLFMYALSNIIYLCGCLFVQDKFPSGQINQMNLGKTFNVHILYIWSILYISVVISWNELALPIL